MEMFKPNLSWVRHDLQKLRNSRFWRGWCWRFKSFGMWRPVVGLAVPDVSKHRNAFIFTAKQTTNNCLTLEDERIMSFRNVENYQPNDTSHIRRLESTQIFLHTDLHVGRSLEKVDVSVLPYILRCVDVDCLVGIHRDQHLSNVCLWTTRKNANYCFTVVISN